VRNTVSAPKVCKKYDGYTPARSNKPALRGLGVFTTAENQGCLGLEAQGSIDVPVIRDHVDSILEGGRDAFIQRKEKYEF
jgi:hypothetical protein